MRKKISTILMVMLLIPVNSGPGYADEPQIQLVETFPIETSLDHQDIPDAHTVWLEMISGSRESLDLAEFYASNSPGSRLEEIIVAIEQAASRGVKVRFLAEEKFYETYPETLERLNTHPNILMRRYNVKPLMGGVLHAKYFLVDKKEAFIGSQNFDWRALTHIQELGVRFSEPASVRALVDLFETDWALSAIDPSSVNAADINSLDSICRAPVPAVGYTFPAQASSGPDQDVSVTPVFSPRDWLPDESLWDLPGIIAMIDESTRSVRVQLLSYRATSRDGTYFPALETALCSAAARGVEVQMLLSHWSQRPGKIEGLQSLQAIPGITVKLMTIPEWSGGFIPFARVVHAKYLVVDGRKSWIGTSNWEHDYFFASRNVGLLIEGESIATRLDRFFLSGWTSEYAEIVDPCRKYTAPRIGQ